MTTATTTTKVTKPDYSLSHSFSCSSKTVYCIIYYIRIHFMHCI